MATNAGIDGAEHYTTHCFRHGGAQYRFMFAPVGQRWTLACIRWWGGWAKNEHVSKYHLNVMRDNQLHCNLSMTPWYDTFWVNSTHMKRTTVTHYVQSIKSMVDLTWVSVLRYCRWLLPKYVSILKSKQRRHTNWSPSWASQWSLLPALNQCNLRDMEWYVSAWQQVEFTHSYH